MLFRCIVCPCSCQCRAHTITSASCDAFRCDATSPSAARGECAWELTRACVVVVVFPLLQLAPSIHPLPLLSLFFLSDCEDDVPTEYEGRKDYDRCFELESTGYAQPTSAFFITCSHSCSQYYQEYLDGKMDGSEIAQPIDVAAVSQAHADIEAAEARRRADADEAAASAAAASVAAAAASRGGRKSKKALAEEAAAAAEKLAQEQRAAAEKACSASNFVFVPPTETQPHVCACLMPKRSKPRLYCLCKTPYDKRRAYLACDACGQWYHLTCVGMKEDADVESIEWTCKGRWRGGTTAAAGAGRARACDERWTSKFRLADGIVAQWPVRCAFVSHF